MDVVLVGLIGMILAAALAVAAAITALALRTRRYRGDGASSGSTWARPRNAKAPGRTGGFMVGDTGIEPVTSSVSGKRATAAPIARHRRAGCGMLRGGDGIRTRVYGFAGRCLASRPRHQECGPDGP